MNAALSMVLMARDANPYEGAPIAPARIAVTIDCPDCGGPLRAYFDANTDECVVGNIGARSRHRSCQWNEHEDALIDNAIRDAARDRLTAVDA